MDSLPDPVAQHLPDADAQKVNILLVDDRAEQRLSLAAVLADLGENIVEASSGREALRWLLHSEFAVILLDINMPGMDGLETAALIRQRPSTAHTPIIFITAHSDDTQAPRGYSLGAVDYILAPVQPDVLRTKVGVFVELFKKTEHIKRQAAALEHRAIQLHKLTEASLAIHSAVSVERILQVVSDAAVAITGAVQCVSTTEMASTGIRRAVAVSRTVTRDDAPPDPPSLPDTAATDPSVERLTIPLMARDGRAIGCLEVQQRGTDCRSDDRAMLLQLAQMTAIAIENTLASEAREANRLKDEFLATLSHELRTPLQAMLGWTAMLRSGRLDADSTRRGLEVIERSAKAQTQLIEDLLDVSRIISGKLRIEPRPLDLGTIVEATLDAVRPIAASKRIDVALTLDRWLGRVCGDATRLQQVLSNLLSNAVKFTATGGRIEVRVERWAGLARIRVSDTGRGIAPDLLPHIFERFRQGDSSTTRPYSGLGIGLAIVRHLVELHGGTVHAESPGSGQGAAFTVNLPIMENGHAQQDGVLIPSPAPAASIPAVLNGLRLDGVRVLIVEDEADARECMTVVLEDCGATVTAVDSVSAALRVLEQSPTDVLLSDLGMPGEDGYALIRQLRARERERGGRIPAAAVTAYARSDDRERILHAGFDAHVGKPVEPAELAQLVSELAGRVPHPSP